MSQSSAITVVQGELVSSKGTQEGEEYLPSSSPQTAATPHGEPQGRSGCKKTTGYWPRIVEVHVKGMTSVSPDSCIFPHIENS